MNRVALPVAVLVYKFAVLCLPELASLAGLHSVSTASDKCCTGLGMPLKCVHTLICVHTHATTLSLTFEVHSVEITTEAEQPLSQLSQPTRANGEGEEEDDGDEEPSVLQALSSEQLARRASFK